MTDREAILLALLALAMAIIVVDHFEISSLRVMQDVCLHQMVSG